jgi:hypothetical protein
MTVVTNKQTKMIYVYCITDNRLYLDSNGVARLAYKIGKAHDAAGRTHALRSRETFIDERFTCVFLIKSENNALEPQFHRQFQEHRVSNMREWFIAPIEHVIGYADEVCSDTGSVFVDYANYIESEKNPKNMVESIKNGSALDREIVFTNKAFQTQTREHIKQRIGMIRNEIALHILRYNHKFTVKDLLNLDLSTLNGKGEMKPYKKRDLYYDIEHLYLEIV